MLYVYHRGGCRTPCRWFCDAQSTWWLSATLCVLLFWEVDLSGPLVNGGDIWVNPDKPSWEGGQ